MGKEREGVGAVNYASVVVCKSTTLVCLPCQMSIMFVVGVVEKLVVVVFRPLRPPPLMRASLPTPSASPIKRSFVRGAICTALSMRGAILCAFCSGRYL